MRSIQPRQSLARRFLLPLAVTGLLLHGCGNDSGAEQQPGGNDDPPQQPAERRLAVVGPALIQLEAGSQATLRVALAEEEVGAVAGEVVEFAIVGEAAGSTLPTGTSATAVTDAHGLAAVDLTAGAQAPHDTTFQVTAVSPGTNTVAFAIRIVRLQHIISIVRTPSVRVASSGTQATAESGAFGRLLLRVRVTDQFGRPVTEVPVTYAFAQPALSASFEDASTVATNPGGEAQVALDTGEHLDDIFEVTARTNESATARWNIQIQTDESQICADDNDCGPGLYCRNGVCQGSAACSNEDPIIECPPGYVCVVNECHPSINIDCKGDDECGPGFVCVDGTCQAENPQCADDEDCPPGFHCQAGVHRDRPKSNFCTCGPECCYACPDRPADGRTVSERCKKRMQRTGRAA